MMAGGQIVDMNAAVRLNLEYDPEILEQMYIVEEDLRLMYWYEWGEEWREVRADFDYERNTVTYA